MKATFHHTNIKGIYTIVPSKIIDIDSELDTIYKGDKKGLERIKKVIGLQTRHIAEKDMTASDLGLQAATRLLESLNVEKESIDALIFVTQSPDYFCPATACYLQGKLGLSQSCLSFDINQACAGYLYGLYVAHSLCDSGGANRVLLIVGDTLSKFVNPLDSNLAPMMGDGVSATLLERNLARYSACDDFLGNAADASLRRMSNKPHSLTLHNPKNSLTILECQDSNNSESQANSTHQDPSNSKIFDEKCGLQGKSQGSYLSGNDRSDFSQLPHLSQNEVSLEKAELQKGHYFELGSDGSKFHQLIIPQGACRIPTKEIITDPKVWQTSETRSLKDLYMDGAEIFSFAVSTYPKTFQSIIDYAQCDKDRIDYFFFHQANKYIVDNITRSLGLPKEKVPNSTTNKYGNLSGCSIPATICDTLAGLASNGLETPLRVHLAGFGAGLAWGNAVVTLDKGFRCQKVGIYE